MSLDGLLAIHDDTVIYGMDDTEEEAMADHNKNLEQFLQEIPYMGHLVTAGGLKLDPNKVEAVRNMPKPNNV